MSEDLAEIKTLGLSSAEERRTTQSRELWRFSAQRSSPLARVGCPLSVARRRTEEAELLLVLVERVFGLGCAILCFVDYCRELRLASVYKMQLKARLQVGSVRYRAKFICA